MDNNNKFMGIDNSTMHHQLNNNLVWNGENKEDVMFTSNREDVFDFLVYTILIYNCSPYLRVCTTNIKHMATLMGYKPKSGKGNINDKIKQSLDRLDDRYLIEYKIEDDLYQIKVNIPKSKEHFFVLHYSTINTILGLEFNMIDDNGEVLDTTKKYVDRAKALYTYCYIVSRMSYIDEEGKVLCSYPTYEEICKDCSISYTKLTKLLRLFEMDGILYTINIGSLKNIDDGSIINTNNYYTTNLENFNTISKYAKGYYSNLGYDVNNKKYMTKKLCKDIDNTLYNIFKHLNTKDSENEENKDYIPYSPLFVTLVNQSFKDFLKSINISYDEYKAFLVGELFNKHKKDGIKSKSVLFLSNRLDISVVYLNHFKNVIDGINELFIVKDNL